jgi:AraC family transcriptional regulator of arabinose operon
MVQAEPLLRIGDLAHEVHLSKSRLEHMFKHETGVCLGHLLTEKRLQRAADLLVHSDMRVKEIASSVGYVHAPSFIRAFVRRFRESPREYRKRKGANY